MENQYDIFEYSINAKMCVMPTYHDIIPGTIIEGMYMKLPVITYSVRGIPELNKEEKTIILLEKQNINQLAESIIILLNDTKTCENLAEKAYNKAKERFNNGNGVNDILRAYNTILEVNFI